MTAGNQDLETSTLRIVLDRAHIDVRDLSLFMDAIDLVSIGANIWLASTGHSKRLWSHGTRDDRMPGGGLVTPRVLSVKNESPVTVVLQSLDVPVLITMIAYLIRNPATLPNLISRYKVDRELAKARLEGVYFWRQQIQAMQDSGVDVNDLPEPPPWVVGKS